MKHTIELDAVNQWAVIRYHGPTYAEHAIALLRAVLAHPDWTPHCARIVVYDDALLGDMEYQTLRDAKDVLAGLIRDAYGDTPTVTAHVCADRYKAPIVDYWITLGAKDYPADLKRFDTLPEARDWIVEQRAAAAAASGPARVQGGDPA